jgi:hypothetical protein
MNQQVVQRGSAANVGQVVDLRPIVNRPAEVFEKSTTGRFPIGRRMPSCPTNQGMQLVEQNRRGAQRNKDLVMQTIVSCRLRHP